MGVFKRGLYEGNRWGAHGATLKRKLMSHAAVFGSWAGLVQTVGFWAGQGWRLNIWIFLLGKQSGSASSTNIVITQNVDSSANCLRENFSKTCLRWWKFVVYIHD